MNKEKIKAKREELAAEIAKLQQQEEMLDKIEQNEEVHKAVIELSRTTANLNGAQGEHKKAIKAAWKHAPEASPGLIRQGLAIYREQFAAKKGDSKIAAKQTIWEILTNVAGDGSYCWTPAAWFQAVAFAEAFEKRRNRIGVAMKHACTDRGDDSHGDLVDAMTLFLDDEHLKELEENRPAMQHGWKKLIEDQRKVWAKNPHKLLAFEFGTGVHVQKNVLNAEKYFSMYLDIAVEEYASSIDWE